MQLTFNIPIKNIKLSDHQESLVIHFTFQKIQYRASLVVEWLRICLPVQGTRVQSLVWEDPACHGAAKPVCHNY